MTPAPEQAQAPTPDNKVYSHNFLRGKHIYFKGNIVSLTGAYKKEYGKYWVFGTWYSGHRTGDLVQIIIEDAINQIFHGLRNPGYIDYNQALIEEQLYNTRLKENQS